MVQRGERVSFDTTVFAQDFMKVQRHIWSVGWKSNPDIGQRSPVVLSRSGLQLCSVAVSRLCVCGWVDVGSLHHTQPPPYRERLTHTVQQATLLTFTQNQATEQRTGQDPVTLKTLGTFRIMPDILADRLNVLDGTGSGVWTNFRHLAVEEHVMVVRFFLQSAGRMMVDLSRVPTVSCQHGA